MKAAVPVIILLHLLTAALAGEDQPSLERLAGSRWMSVFIRGEKTGWVHATLERKKVGEDTCWVLSYESLMRFHLLDRKLEMRSREETGYEVEPPHAMVFYESSVETNDGVHGKRAIRRGDAFDIETERGGATTRRRVELHHTALDALAPEMMALKRSAAGAKGNVTLFIPELMRDEAGTTTVEKVAKGASGGDLYTITTRCASFTRREVYSADGVCVESLTEPGFLLKSEPKEKALEIGSGADLGAMSRTPPLPEPLGNPAEIRKLTLEILGAPEGLPGARQAGGPGWVRVEIAPPGAPEEVESPPADLSPYLEADERITSGEEEIRDKAAGIAGSEKGLFARAAKIVGWVHATLEKRPRAQLSSALEVLQKGYGDCTEHAMLCAALCRAAGVPARVVTGLVYCGDESRSFGAHAWVEFWCGGWRAADPAYGQETADATHVKFAEGLNPYSLLAFTGKVEVRVVAVER